MSTNINAAADSLLALAEQFRPIQDVATALKELGSLDQAIAERKKAYAEGIAAHEGVKASVAKAHQDLADVRDHHVKEVGRHNDQAANIVERAKADAAQIVVTARAEAGKLVKDAQGTIAGIQADHKATIDAYELHLKELGVKIAEANSQHEAAVARLAQVTHDIEEMQKLARKVA